MKTLLGILLLFGFTLPPSLANEPSAASAAAFQNIVKALTSDDYELFIAEGDAAFRGLKKPMFESVVTQLAPRFEAGYETTYLGQMRQKGYEVTLWKFAFKDGGDDMLGTLSLKDGKVGGFWIK